MWSSCSRRECRAFFLKRAKSTPRRAILLRKIIYQRLRIFSLKGNNAGELPGDMRIGEVEPLLDEFRMGLVLGEDDRIPDPVTACHLHAVNHHMSQHLVDGVGIQQPFVDGLRIVAIRRIAIFVIHSSMSHCSCSVWDKL